jgi:hypothetical protein
VSTPQIEGYRAAAAGERLAADEANLPHVRDRHLRSAEAWEAMADHAERTVQLAEANAEGKVKQTYQRRDAQ